MVIVVIITVIIIAAPAALAFHDYDVLKFPKTAFCVSLLLLGFSEVRFKHRNSSHIYV